MSVKKIMQVIFPGCYGILVYATVRVLQDTESGFSFWRRPLLVSAIEVTVSVFVGYLSVMLINRLCAYNDNRYAADKAGAPLLLKEVGLVAVISIIVVNCTLTPMAASTDDGLSRGDLAYINVVPLLYMMIYYGGLRSNRFLNAYVHQQLIVEKLTNDRLDTELKFLKAQYHPHFLFNALNTVYFQMDEDIPAAKQSLEKLSELLRYQLYDQQQKVTMRQELQHLQNFMALQKARSSQQLHLKIDIDEQVQNVSVYPLLFLPLVENAFKYAGGDFCIRLEVFLRDNNVTMKIENSLPVQDMLPVKQGGIGLENVKRRLTLLYPDKHLLLLKKDKHSFVAQISLDIS